MLTLPYSSKDNGYQKRSLLILVFIGLAFASALYIYENKREQHIYQQYIQLIKESSKINAEDLSAKILANTKSIQLLSKLPYIKEFTLKPLSLKPEDPDYNKTLNQKKQVTHVFMAFLDQEKDIRQARLILSDGSEYIRVERNNNGVIVTPSNLLQSKEDRDYFKTGMKLSDKEVYVSQISPNYEHDKIEFPIWPTYRIITNLRGEDNSIIGLLIINIDASESLKKLNAKKQTVLLPFENYLIDNNGFYVASPDPALLFGNDLAQEEMNWFSHTDNSTPLIANDNFQVRFKDKDYLFSAQKINLPNSIIGKQYYLLTGLSIDRIHQEILTKRKELLIPMVGFTILFICIVLFFLRHIKQLEKLHLSQSHFKAIISNSSDAILSINKAGEILNWNQAATILFGLNTTEAIGQNFLDLIDDKSKQLFNLAFLDNIIANNTNERIEVIPKNKHSVNRTLLLTLGAIDTKDGSNQSIALIIRDITHQKANQVKLESLNAALDDKVKVRTKELEAEKHKALKANQIKSMFVANISHEIRTPLNGVSGLLALARDKRNQEKCDDYLKMAQDSAQALNVLINDLLDFSKIESGKLELNPKPFNIRSLLEQVITSTSFLVKDKNIELILDTSRIEVDWIMQDEHRIKQILTNLLSNAIKFTNEGEVILTASTYVSQENKDKVVCEFQVNDTGVGIPKDQQSKLFQPFIQASAGIANKYGGTGLGLSISKQLCEMMDGALTLTSLIGEGSTFKALIQSELIQSKLYNENSGLINFATHSVAIFVEHDQIRRVLRNQLHAWKAKSFLIQNNTHFYEQIKQNKLSLAIIDHQLFDQELDQHLKEQSIRAIYLTTMHRTDEFQFKGSCITTPILPSELESFIAHPDKVNTRQEQDNSLVGSDISNGKVTQANLDNESEAPSSQIESNAENMEQRVYVVDDNEINLIVGKGILNDLPVTIDTAINGEDILDKLRALTTQDYLPVILMDCQMPSMDGYTATRLIREGKAGEWLKNTPIIAMTADAMIENRAECEAAGMNDFIGKPFDPEKLKALVMQWSHKKF